MTVDNYVHKQIKRGFNRSSVVTYAFQEYRRLLEEEGTVETPTSISEMVELMNNMGISELEYPTHYQPYIELLENIHLGQAAGRVCFSSAPQVGKTTITLIALLWYAWTKPKASAAYVTYSATRSYEVQSQLVPWLQALGIQYKYSQGKIQLKSIGNRTESYDSSITFSSRGGGLTGSSFSLIVIDDIIKNQEEATSETVLASTWDWYRTVALTRDSGDLSVVTMATRWSKHDLIGKIITNNPETNYIRIPAICDDEENDPINRELGQSIVFQKRNKQFFLKVKEEMGEYLFSCMYQGLPSQETQNFKQAECFSSPELQDNFQTVYGLDMAYTTSKKSDFSVCYKLKVNPTTGTCYVVDCIRKQCFVNDFIEEVKKFTRYEPGPIFWDASGMEMNMMLGSIKKELPYLRISVATKAKKIRALDLINAWNNGWIKVPVLPSVQLQQGILVVESFGFGAHDDDVDALASAYNAVKYKRLEKNTTASLSVTPHQSRELEEKQRLIKERRISSNAGLPRTNVRV